MPNEMSNGPIRDDLVNTAVKFLTNPNILKTSLVDQQKFLKRKGLTNDEIQLACQKAGIDVYHNNVETDSFLPATQPPVPSYGAGYGTISIFNQIKEIVHNISIFSFMTYIVYKFYKKCIYPFLFGKEKSVDESIQDLDQTMKSSMDELKNNLQSVKIEVDRISQGAESNVQHQLRDLKSEIATIKGLLLNRSQFPQPSGKSSLVRSSIPSWQKTSINQDSDPDSDPERKAEDLMEIGSVSGSSEPEQNTKNSDSSLEIISYASSKECDSDFHIHKSKEDLDKEF